MTEEPRRAWAAVAADVQAALRAHDGAHDAGTKANLDDLLRFLQREGSAAPFIDPGYWPTFIVGWGDGCSASVEVFGDRYELYRSFEERTEIEYLAHQPGEPLPEVLMSALRACFPR